MSDVPGGMEFLLLALAGYRVTRLIGWDSITEKLRNRLLTRRHGVLMTVREKQRAVVSPRNNLLTRLIHCPWCLGFWISLGWWAAWMEWPHGTLVAATPWAISGVVGLVSKNLDP